MQATDAARRLAILRGETPPPLPEPEPTIDPSSTTFARRDDKSNSGTTTRKRKRNGEDDTDFEMRLVRERAEIGARVAGELGGGGGGGGKRREVELVGRDGHIDLVGAPPEMKGGNNKEGRNPEYEEEAARKRREIEDQYTMRFSNAAGRDGFAAGDPWYASAAGARKPATAREAKEGEVGMEAPTKNVWGRDDPKRQDREVKRIMSNDPLAMMKMGAKKVRDIEKERKKEDAERERELEQLKRDERRREKRRKAEKHDRHDREARHRDRDSHRHRTSRSEHTERRDDDRREHRSRHRSERQHGEERHRSVDKETQHGPGDRPMSGHSSHPQDQNSHRHRHRQDEDHER